ncbi:MAG: hypothetical protein JWM82_1901 [Myxococcales bacterium]|nr:hypothetical protein [Myxococcales bacterium]
MTLRTLRGSAVALVAACAAWASGCATQKPLVDPVFASGAYAPARIAVLPPDVYVVLDQVGDNDDAKSAALGAAVSSQTVVAVEKALRARGYDVDLSSRWDGIVAQDGSVLVSRDELGWLANGVLQFANEEDAPDKKPAAAGAPAPFVSRFVAPEIAAKVGWATQSDAVLYVNVKGVDTTNGKRAASILAGVFIVVIVAAIVLAIAASSKGGSGNSPGSGLGGGGKPVPSTSVWRGTPTGGASAPTKGTWGGTPVASAPSGGAWRGGNAVARPAGAPVYGGGYGGGPHVGVGIFIPIGPVGGPVPLVGPAETHDGAVTHEDELFAGDELYVAMTLVATYDGRVLWHARQDLDLDADDPRDVDRMVQSFLGQLPARGAPAPAAPAKH